MSLVYLSPPHMGGQEIRYINEAFSSNWIAPLGKNVNDFESSIVNYTGCNYCTALCSGTASIHLALILLNVKRNDEVLCSSFTFSASANPIRYLHAKPIFVDSEAETWNICPIALEFAIQDRMKKGKKPKACIIVHLYGMPCKLQEVIEVCKKYEISVIEDAAEALGSAYKTKKLGTFGELGIFSFNGNKIITTSGGGALISNKKDHIDKALFLATQARDEAPHYQHSEIGYNYRLSNISAGIGLGQMQILDSHIAKRREINRWYREILAPFRFIEFQNEPSNVFFSNYWLTVILINQNDKGINLEKLNKQLSKDKIESRPVWKPMHLQPIFSGFPFYHTGVSEDYFEKGLCLPSGSNLSEVQKSRIKESLYKILG